MITKLDEEDILELHKIFRRISRKHDDIAYKQIMDELIPVLKTEYHRSNCFDENCLGC